MADPQMFWLIVANIVMGLLVAIAVLGLVAGLIWQFASRAKKRRSISHELNHDMKRLFHGRPFHR